jgi:hypothetical protein
MKLARFKRTKVISFLSYVEYRPNTNLAILLKVDHTKRGHIRDEWVKRRKFKK